MTALDIYQEYYQITAIEAYDRAKKNLVEQWSEDEVIYDPGYEDWQREMGIDLSHGQ